MFSVIIFNTLIEKGWFFWATYIDQGFEMSKKEKTALEPQDISLLLKRLNDLEEENFRLKSLSGQTPSAGFISDHSTKRNKELKNTEALADLLDNAPSSVIVHDPQGHILYANKKSFEYYGYSEPEFMSLNLNDMMTPDARVLFDANLKKMHKKDETFFEMFHRRKDGSVLPLLVNARFVRWDGIKAILSVASDITERKKADEALEKRMTALIQPLDSPEGIAFENLFNLKDLQHLQDSFAEATGVAALITHTDGTPITAPSNFCRLCSETIRKSETGRSLCMHSDSTLGRDCVDGPTIRPCLSAGLWGAGAGISVGGRHIANFLIGQVRDGTQTDEQMRKYARKLCVDEEEFVKAFHEVPFMTHEQFTKVALAHFTLANQLSAYAYQNLQQARFITDRKRAEEEREKLHVQLFQAQKMESVGRLAGGVAHDFNNMLLVILGHAELALSRIDPDHPLYADLQEIRKAAERSANLTQQLLAFARKQTVTPRVLDLNETVKSMLNMLKRLIGEDIDLAWLPGEKLWPVKIDPSQIDQILANLCVNARDAIADTGRITIETRNIVLDETYSANHPGFNSGEYIRLTVSDNGSGMSKETQEKLFEPFFTTKGMGKGTGLGLAMVYGIIKQNNGFINVYSEPGHGTTFNIYLPRSHSSINRKREEKPASPDRHGHETILLVEDDPAILQLTTIMLKHLGYTVLAFSTPDEAIRSVEKAPDKIHLLMTDVVMPGMNGKELSKRLLSTYPELRHLFMSGYTANVIAHHGVLDEGVHFIQKPFSLNELALKVRETLE